MEADCGVGGTPLYGWGDWLWMAERMRSSEDCMPIICDCIIRYWPSSRETRLGTSQRAHDQLGRNSLCRAVGDPVGLIFLLWFFEYALGPAHLAAPAGSLGRVSDRTQRPHCGSPRPRSGSCPSCRPCRPLTLALGSGSGRRECRRPRCRRP